MAHELLRWLAMKLQVVCVAMLVVLVGCKAKKRYSPSCQRSTALTAPWNGYQLPTAAGRVCSSDPTRAELQYLAGDRASWEASYDAALVAAGFAKDRCTSQSCTYQRGDEKATVQVLQANKWVTVVVRR